MPTDRLARLRALIAEFRVIYPTGLWQVAAYDATIVNALLEKLAAELEGVLADPRRRRPPGAGTMTRQEAQALGVPNLWLLLERLVIRTGPCDTDLNQQADLARAELFAAMSNFARPLRKEEA